MSAARHWDIFCKVIDNYGDVGVCWRLCCDLAARGQAVRLWVDDASALAWMAPQGCPGVEVFPWSLHLISPFKKSATHDFYVIIESFSSEISPEFIAGCANHMGMNGRNKFSWINLEYISAEKYPDDCHRLPSPVFSGPAKGLTKHFFYPGFTPRTGGLLREPDLAQRQARFDRSVWLQAQGIADNGDRLISLFCYEPVALAALLRQLAEGPLPTHLLVTHGRAARAVGTWAAQQGQALSAPFSLGQLSLSYLPALTQRQYDELLWACDINFVRGEDSLVRALWAGKPFVWHIYPQDDNAHHAKLDAFLRTLGASASLTSFHHRWNGMGVESNLGKGMPLPALDAGAWGDIATRARARLMLQPDLTTQLMAFVESLQHA